MDRYLHAEVSKRLAEARCDSKEEAQSKSIISLVLKTYLAENRGSMNRALVDEEFKKVAAAQVRIFLFAGHDTTSSTLIFCYHELARHPDVLARVRTEHSLVFGKDCRQAGSAIREDPTRLNRIPYTMAVIREVLRLHPPSSQMRRGRAGFDLVDLDGTRLPTDGCNIWVLTNSLHVNPRHWGGGGGSGGGGGDGDGEGDGGDGDARSFRPERWLAREAGGDPPRGRRPDGGAWRPFMLGPRSCIGQTLALTELRVALVMTAREFDVRPAYGEWDARHRPRGVREVYGERAYAAEKGGGGAHPSDGYPCRVERCATESGI
jgi:sterigmatocystin biosynthesis cytochrome P450 monooxygenase